MMQLNALVDLFIAYLLLIIFADKFFLLIILGLKPKGHFILFFIPGPEVPG